jgi:nucleoside-diphosphate-sugar epimerase
MITILGASGFIGQRLTARLEQRGVAHYAPARHESLAGKKLGDVIYSIGLTADFRSRPFDTVEAHVCKLAELLREADFDSLLYVSSTRLYDGLERVGCEEDALRVAPLDPGDLYNISKAMGESIALNCGRHTRVARISNVYGGDFSSDNFLSSLIRDAISGKPLVLRTSPGSAKDYVSVEDVADGLIAVATRGTQRVYNIAGGTNVSNGELLENIRGLTGCSVEFPQDAPEIRFPPVSIARMREEFDYAPSQLLENLAGLVALYKDELGISHD